MQVNSRPSSHLPYLLWTMANALVEAGVARRSGNRRRAILAGNQARGRRVLQLGELPAEEAANLTVLCMGYRARCRVVGCGNPARTLLRYADRRGRLSRILNAAIGTSARRWSATVRPDSPFTTSANAKESNPIRGDPSFPVPNTPHRWVRISETRALLTRDPERRGEGDAVTAVDAIRGSKPMMCSAAGVSRRTSTSWG